MDTYYSSSKDELARKMLRSSVRLMQMAIVHGNIVAVESGLKGLGLACELLMKMVGDKILTFEEAAELCNSESELACGECYTEEMAKSESKWVIENALDVLYERPLR
jgi:hypothetical protein